MTQENRVDLVIMGAGVVGLAIAQRCADPQQTTLILERNATFGTETSSRNSEVIHAGIYYPTGSLKARWCVEGREMLYRFCEEYRVPHRRIGKLIVATNADEAAALEAIAQQASSNGVEDLQLIDDAELVRREPLLRGASALLSPSTGIIDAHSLMQALLARAEQRGAQLVCHASVERIVPQADGSMAITIHQQGEHFTLLANRVVNAAGLGAQSIAHSIEGLDPSLIPRLHLCKGHYFSLTGKSPFQQLIYPVPERNHKGLGVHATLDLAGQVKFGPDTQYIDRIDYLNDPDRHDSFGRAIQRYYPSLDVSRLQPAYCGVRPKIQGPDDPFRDFVVQDERVHQIHGLVQLFGIESPGLTSCLAIAEAVAETLSS